MVRPYATSTGKTSILAIAIAFLLLAAYGATAATPSFVSVQTPRAAGTVTSSRTIDFRFDIDTDPANGCMIQFGLTNGSVYNNGSTTNFTAALNSNSRTYNYTFAVPIDSSVGNFHNWSVYCGEASTSMTLIATNTYKLRTRTPTMRSPVNGSISNNSLVALNATVAVGLPPGGLCWYDLVLYNSSTALDLGWKLMNFSDSTNTSAINGTVVTMANNTNAQQHNITFRCNDTTGNMTSEVYQFRIDQLAPTLSINNATVLASTMTLNTSITDNNTGTCAITINGTAITATVVGTGVTSYCTGSTTGSGLGNGNVTVSYTATDASGNAGSASTKQLIKESLVAGWNYLAVPIQANLSTLCGMVSTCDQVSWYNNTAKTFTTYALTAPTTNNGFTPTVGDGILIHTTAADTFISDDFLPNTGIVAGGENMSIVLGYNLIGLTRKSNLTGIVNFNVSNANSTTYYDGTTYNTCNNASLCSGGVSPGNIHAPKGAAVWLLAINNATFTRSTVGE